MKKMAVLSAFVLWGLAGVVAQGGIIPGKGDFGLGFDIGNNHNYIDAYYNITENIVLVPRIGFYSYNYADTASGTTTNYPGTWWDGGLGVYYAVKLFDSLSIQVGPSAEYSSEKYENNGNTNQYQYTYWSITANGRLLAMLTKNIGVQALAGVYFYSNDTNNTTTSIDTLKTGYGVQSLSLGGVIYLK